MYIYVLLIFLPLLVSTEMEQEMQERAISKTFNGIGNNSWITDRILNVVETFIPYSRSCNTMKNFEEGTNNSTAPDLTM